MQFNDPDFVRDVLDKMQGHQYQNREMQSLFTSLNAMRDENDRLRSALNGLISIVDRTAGVVGDDVEPWESFDEVHAAREALGQVSEGEK